MGKGNNSQSKEKKKPKKDAKAAPVKAAPPPPAKNIQEFLAAGKKAKGRQRARAPRKEE